MGTGTKGRAKGKGEEKKGEREEEHEETEWLRWDDREGEGEKRYINFGSHNGGSVKPGTRNIPRNPQG